MLRGIGYVAALLTLCSCAVTRRKPASGVVAGLMRRKSEASPAHSTPSPAVGRSRENAVPLGEETTLNVNDQMIMTIKVAQVVRGSQADEMVRTAGITRQPGAGKEWLLVRMAGECVNDAFNGTIFGSEDRMRVYSNGQDLPQTHASDGAVLEPQLRNFYWELSPIDGWAVLEAYPGDPHPLLFIEERDLYGADGKWFALS